MILDFNTQDLPATFEADLCIVGSGAAALAILWKYRGHQQNIIVIEAGGENITDRDQEIYDLETTHLPLYGAKTGRFRVFGGSTTKWGGQSLPLSKMDFRKRGWVEGSGWPVAYDDISAYYPQVDEFLGLERMPYDSDVFEILHVKKLPGSDDLRAGFSKWSPHPNLRERFRKQIETSQTITLLQHANVVEIELTDNQKEVVAVHIKTFGNKYAKVRSRRFVLACGGIENARLLLASNRQCHSGVGNHHDVVGRYFQDHPNLHLGSFIGNSRTVQSYFNYQFVKRTRILPRFMMSEQFQERHRTLNASAFFNFLTDEENPFFALKELYRKYKRGGLSSNDLKTVPRLLRRAPELIAVAGAYVARKKVYAPGADAKLTLIFEMPPRRENRIALSQQRDELGMQKVVLSWNYDELLIRTVYKTADAVMGYLNATGLGCFRPEAWYSEKHLVPEMRDIYHHIGTTRMASTANEGVVDENCKVFEISNLYIAGSSVFPTSGHSNPTATIIALAFRLAEHLQKAQSS